MALSEYQDKAIYCIFQLFSQCVKEVTRKDCTVLN